MFDLAIISTHRVSPDTYLSRDSHLQTFVPLFLEVINEEPEPEVLIVLFMAFKVRLGCS